jgi:hypothetical protein
MHACMHAYINADAIGTNVMYVIVGILPTIIVLKLVEKMLKKLKF